MFLDLCDYSYLKYRYVFFIPSLLGWVTVWDDTDYDVLEIANGPITNNKLYLKHVKLDEYSITTLICIQKY